MFKLFKYVKIYKMKVEHVTFVMNPKFIDQIDNYDAEYVFKETGETITLSKQDLVDKKTFDLDLPLTKGGWIVDENKSKTYTCDRTPQNHSRGYTVSMFLKEDTIKTNHIKVYLSIGLPSICIHASLGDWKENE